LSKSILFEADWRLKVDPLAERDDIFEPRIALLTEVLKTSGNGPLTILDAACASGSFAAFFRTTHASRLRSMSALFNINVKS
jgi:hypothetical protein